MLWHSTSATAPTPTSLSQKSKLVIRKAIPSKAEWHTKKSTKFLNKICYSSLPLIFNFKGDTPRWAVIFIITACPWAFRPQHIPLVTEWYQLYHRLVERGKKEKKPTPHRHTPHPSTCTKSSIIKLVSHYSSVADTRTPLEQLQGDALTTLN